MTTVIHPLHVHVNEDQSNNADWVDVYGDVAKEIPADMLEPLVNPNQMVTGHLIFVEQARTLWYSKHQNTVDASTFGADFIVVCTCLE
eukprot:5266170-Ditylum_brightwellii.AAC.1